MAFFSALSSSIGRKLLLYGLRHIDILDKDPADFVSVDVGKRTTLEVRDVGLHIKACREGMSIKLVALLHLQLPPEVHLSKARASLLRVTFVLDFGVPQISIEVDGIQVQARLVDHVGEALSPPSAQQPVPSQPSPPRPRASPPPTRDDRSDAGSDHDEHVPTVDELAKSFIRAEPAEEIRELQEELASQSPYMQDELSSSDDGDEGTAGMGAPLALPAYLKNVLNTALDRLSITVNDIHVEVEDQSSKDAPDASRSTQASPVSLNFHVERVAIDSMSSKDVRVQVASTTPFDDTKLGKRRMRVENICARLVSDMENFVSLSRFSQPPSPVTNRSQASIGQKAPSEPSASRMSMRSTREEEEGEGMPEPPGSPEPPEAPEAPEAPEPPVDGIPASPIPSPPQAPTTLREETVSPVPPLPLKSPSPKPPSPKPPSPEPPSPEQPRLNLSVHTVDDDRFADANSDDGLDDRSVQDSLSHSRQSLPARDLGGSDLLYDEDGMLDYAMQNDMLNSRFDDAPNMEASAEVHETWGLDGAASSRHTRMSEPASNASTSDLPTVSALGRSFHPPSATDSPSQSAYSEKTPISTDNLAAAHQHPEEDTPSPVSSVHEVPESPPPEDEDLAESKFFTHDEAESMYMSAVSAAQANSTHPKHIPGGWDSSSASSKDSASDTSGSIPEDMISGSILAPAPEIDDGYDTPRPRSRQSSVASSHAGRLQTPTPATPAVQKQAKRLLTIDVLTVWFPMGLDDGKGEDEQEEDTTETADFDFKPSNLGEDSIFAEMPGSFSNYAYSSSHRSKPTLDASTRARAPSKPSQPPNLPKQPKKSTSPSISVEVGSVVGNMDLSTGRVMFAMFNRMMQAITSQPRQEEDKLPSPASIAPPKDSNSSLEMSIKCIAFSWLENVMTESVQEGYIPTSQLDPNPMGAILRVGLSMVRVHQQSLPQESRSQIQIGKVVLASLDQDIISFQSSRSSSKRMSSTLPEQLGNDVEVDYVQGKDDRITVVTRPVKVMFDIQKLDDALGSFGGFSGMLELSSSISSASTVQSPVIAASRPRPRGVHFGDGLPPPVKTPAAPVKAPKIQLQFGEVSFLLKGKTCSVQLQTTSVRIAVRQSNVRLKVSEIQLMGPYTEAGQDNTPFIAELKGTTLNFLFAPEEMDLTRLISMITPSKDPYENDDDILIETLLRQRRKGSVLRVEIAEVGVRISDLQQMKTFEALGAELARLSKVTKYLPDDDRPGLLCLASVKTLDVRVVVNEKLGDVSITLQDAALAHVGVPALLATEIGKMVVRRDDEVLIHQVVRLRPSEQLPTIMMRMVGDEMEPVAKVKLFNLCVEYRVSTVMAALGISEDGTVDDLALGIASSVATITGATSPQTLSRQSSQTNPPSPSTAKPLQIDLLMRNCAIGLNPRKTSSKGLFVLTEAHIAGRQARNDYSVTVELRKASMHAIDDVARLEEEEPLPASPITTTNRQLQELNQLGYVSLSSISAAKVYVKIAGDGQDQPQLVDVEFKNELFVIESCADSTQTLIAILNGLQPPSPPSTAEQYRTVVPLQQMMESFTGDALIQDDDIEADDFMSNADLVEDDLPTNLEFVGSIYNSQSLPTEEDMGDSLLDEDDLGVLASPPITRQRGDRALLESFQEKYEVTQGEEDFDFRGEYFSEADTEQKGKARKWDSAKNQYHLSNEFKVPDAPLKVRVHDVNIIWNLYDGYDWPRTRSVISQAVDDVEARAEERRRRAREEEEDDDFVEEDFLFNSVWIGVPVKDEKGALARRINHDIDDLVSETGSYATSTATRSTGATSRPRSTTKSRRRLKLERSKHKKIAFSLMGVAVDLIVFPPDSGETINSINVRVQDLEVFDHVPTSTWKKFVTCAIDPSVRELIRPMISLELVTVKPVTDLAASELVIKVTVLPLRLHVDQDALDFITRFFEFKDDSAPTSPPAAEQPFIQRLEVMAVSMKLDYKPKRVDYRGLRSGHTTEFMNFLILDGSDIVLRHAIVYGITSFDKLHKTLNDVWMPDVQENQLPGVLSGLAAVRPLVNVGSGLKDLVVIPMREYKKDGRIVRSLQKGVYAFAKNTTSEVARLGAKVAIGTQNLLEGAEVFLNPQTASPRHQSNEWDGEDPTSDSEEPRAVSNYANQPIGVRAGLRSAARHLERDLLTARDAVIAIPAEVMEEGSGTGVARALARHAPTVILRPALGATKALSNALLGVGNALDAGSRRKIEDASTHLSV
ncbi:autophagy regulatory protein [Stemphylium lycopersici]|uniref:Autophagy-related protein 2 n=1 Tax=Stemphylium lycopersici TaxID=183478 RepID=A0A364N660_STELY|nr:autophagy regulatory protein [Stemphylium lycopersici]